MLKIIPVVSVEKVGMLRIRQHELVYEVRLFGWTVFRTAPVYFYACELLVEQAISKRDTGDV